MRTLRLALQAALGQEVGVHHPGCEWLVQHAADILIKCSAGRDGRTPYERVKKKTTKKYGGDVKVWKHGSCQAGGQHQGRTSDREAGLRST